MRMKGYLFLLVTSISLCLLAGWRVKGQAPTFSGVVYEYKVIRIAASDAEVEKRLNELGAQRWELVAVQSVADKGGVVYYLKRQITIVTKG
jgi:hypothetical protein